MRADRLFAVTRDPGFLWKSSLVLFSHAFLLACLLQWGAAAWAPAYKRFLLADEAGERHRAPALAAKVLATSDLTQALDVVMRLADFASQRPDVGGHEPVNTRFIEGAIANRSRGERAILLAAWQSALSEEGVVGTPISQLADDPDPPQGAAYSAGFVAVRLFDLNEAEAWFAKEQSPPYAALARAAELRLVADRRKSVELEALLARPDYYAAAPLDLRLQYDVNQTAWGAALATAWLASWRGHSWQAWAISLLAAGVWGGLALRLANVSRLRDPRLAWAAAAFVAGIGSAVVTLIFVYWQETRFGLRLDGSLAGDFLYFFAGVALREEALKLLAVAPLLWFLRGDADDRRVLLLGGMAGLGFAVTENVTYVDASTAGTGFSRFLSANFLHLATTALSAQGFVTWLRHPARGFDHFLFRFTAVVLVHGGYNLVISQAALGEYAVFSLILLGILAYWYFHEVRLARVVERITIALSAFFVLGMASLLAMGYVLCAWDYGLLAAFRIMLQAFLGTGLLLFLFLREFERV